MSLKLATFSPRTILSVSFAKRSHDFPLSLFSQATEISKSKWSAKIKPQDSISMVAEQQTIPFSCV